MIEIPVYRILAAVFNAMALITSIILGVLKRPLEQMMVPVAIALVAIAYAILSLRERP